MSLLTLSFIYISDNLNLRFMSTGNRQLSLCIIIIVNKFKSFNNCEPNAIFHNCCLKNDCETQWNYPKLVWRNRFGWEFKDQKDLILTSRWFNVSPTKNNPCIRLQNLFPPQCLQSYVHCKPSIMQINKKEQFIPVSLILKYKYIEHRKSVSHLTFKAKLKYEGEKPV